MIASDGALKLAARIVAKLRRGKSATVSFADSKLGPNNVEALVGLALDEAVPVTPTTQFIDFKILRMPCCGHQLCWVNPRYPTHCPECGTTVYPLIKNPHHQILRSEKARIVY